MEEGLRNNLKARCAAFIFQVIESTNCEIRGKMAPSNVPQCLNKCCVFSLAYTMYNCYLINGKCVSLVTFFGPPKFLVSI